MARRITRPRHSFAHERAAALQLSHCKFDIRKFMAALYRPVSYVTESHRETGYFPFLQTDRSART
jgi:hypothetical protein